MLTQIVKSESTATEHFIISRISPGCVLHKLSFQHVLDLVVGIACLFINNFIDVFGFLWMNCEEKIRKCGELQLLLHEKNVAPGALAAYDTIDQVSPESFKGNF